MSAKPQKFPVATPEQLAAYKAAALALEEAPAPWSTKDEAKRTELRALDLKLRQALRKAEEAMPLVAQASLTKTYGKHAVKVLTAHKFVTLVHVDRGEDQKALKRFAILQELPPLDKYAALRDETFKTTLGSMLSDAFSMFSDLRDQLSDWYDNLPESFQGSDKGSTIESARDAMEEASSAEFELAAPFDDLPYVHLPNECSSRSDTCAEAISILSEIESELNDVAETLKEIAEMPEGEERDEAMPEWLFDFLRDRPETDKRTIADLAEEAEEKASECADIIGNAEGTEFPGMY